MLTHWNWGMLIYISKIIIIGSDNGLSPGQRPAIIWTNAAILVIGLLGINFNEVLIEINTISLKNTFDTVVCKTAFISFRLQWFNTVAVDALAPCIARPSADMVLTTQENMSCLPWWSISTTHIFSLLEKDRKYKFIFIIHDKFSMTMMNCSNSHLNASA